MQKLEEEEEQNEEKESFNQLLSFGPISLVRGSLAGCRKRKLRHLRG
jgi:hypothetical protein